MITRERATLAVAILSIAGCASAPSDAPRTPASGPNLGQVASAAQVAAADISVAPSGAGLPPGSGSVKDGAAVYAAQCESCHGPKGVGKPADALVGGIGTLAQPNAVRTVGSYWPYATTLFDYVRRAMPTTAPLTLTNDQVYAVTAYVLHLNGIVGDNAVMDAQSLPKVRMPNRDGFVDYSGKR